MGHSTMVSPAPAMGWSMKPVGTNMFANNASAVSLRTKTRNVLREQDIGADSSKINRMGCLGMRYRSPAYRLPCRP